MCVSESRERVSQQSAFSCDCAAANWLLYFKEADQSALDTSLLAETPSGQNAASVLQSFTVVMLKQKIDENRALGHP